MKSLLKKLVGKGIKKVKIDRPKVVVMETEEVQEEPAIVDTVSEDTKEYVLKRAKRFARLFAAAKRNIPGVSYCAVVKEGSNHFTCFVRLVEKFEEIQQTTGQEIDIVAYIKAHAAYYGQDLYPSHLITRHSFKLYRTYLAEHTAETIQLTKDERIALDAEMLRNLSETRGETEAEVLDALRDSGLFSTDFLKERDLG